ncbi:MAG: tRNA pseudouridine(55) synthase TruB [Desulfobacterales bacterium]|nr:tRNA pseudouridine(55) synthase TruB [Desulfobacterales bacterium]
MGAEPNGFFIIDKPADITSARVVAVVKRLLGARKVGHTGTLDPFATGVLILPVNEATKLARFFLHGRKTYDARLCLGVCTDTQDGEGEVIRRSTVPALSGETIREAFKRFVGEIFQTPPAHSALKHKGTPLYKYARKGVPIVKPARRVFISSIRVREILLPEIRFTVSCSGGVYIRALSADVGDALGCGAHLKTLRRTESGGFSIEEAIPLDRFKDLAASGSAWERLAPMADALRGMPARVVDDALAAQIRNGRPLTTREIPREDAKNDADGSGEFIKIVNPANDLLAVATVGAESGRWRYCKVFQH